MAREELVLRIGGESGEGVISTGELITLAAARAGYHICTFRTYPAEIKGGHAVFQLRLAKQPLHTPGDEIDILLAFNQEGFDKHHKELRSDGTLIHEIEGVEVGGSPVEKKFGMPLADIAKNQIKMPLAKNMVALGAVGRLFSIPAEILQAMVKEKFGRKGQTVIEKNLQALEAGKSYVEQNFPNLESLHIPVKKSDDHIVLSGNEAIALGAIVAGCRYYYGYPITPATDIMEFLAAELPKLGGAVVQAEDEIAALGMAIGTSFAGHRAMTATSGPGLSLMTELLGLAGMAELPVVVADIQRAGPSTGMPTKTEQSDLDLAIYGRHGEAPRIVMSPMNVEDCFYQTINAFNLAERCQAPVLLLSDTALAVRNETIRRPDLSKIHIDERLRFQPGSGNGLFKRYQFTETGVSPMAFPGTPEGNYVATGIEHNEAGRPNYDPANHMNMVDKRYRKVYSAAGRFPPVETLGDAGAEVGVISWGSTLAAVREAVERAQAQGIKIISFYPRVLYPLPDGYLLDPLKKIKRLIVPELNATGQFANLLERRYRGEIIRLNTYGGLPFKPSTIYERIREVANG